MGGAGHLGKVDNCNGFVISDHQIELVEITVDETMLGERDDLVYQLVVNCLGVRETLHVHHGVRFD